MSEEITREVFEHLVELAALELTPQEAEYIRQQLNAQLKAIHELKAIPLDSTANVTSHGVPFTAAISPEPRADEWLPFVDRADLLAQVPDLEGGYIIVPEIPHTDLE